MGDDDDRIILLSHLGDTFDEASRGLRNDGDDLELQPPGSQV